MIHLPAYCRPAAFSALAGELPELESARGLVRAACAIAAHEQPFTKPGETERALDKIVETVEHRAPSSNPHAMLAHLHDVMFDLLEFHGNVDDYYAPENCYLPDVVATRRGMPITLSLVYKYVAEQLGLTVHGVNAPGHFMVAVETTEGNQRSLMFVDPFCGGKLLSIPEAFERIEQATGRQIHPDPALLAPADHRMWLARILLNLQAQFARSGRERDLYAMQELQTLLEIDHDRESPSDHQG